MLFFHENWAYIELAKRGNEMRVTQPKSTSTKSLNGGSPNKVREVESNHKINKLDGMFILHLRVQQKVREPVLGQLHQLLLS